MSDERNGEPAMDSKNRTNMEHDETRTARMIRHLGYRVRDLSAESASRRNKLQGAVQIRFFRTKPHAKLPVDEMSHFSGPKEFKESTTRHGVN